MKKILFGLAVIGLACPALALDRAQLNQQLQTLTDDFTTMQQSDKRVPADQLAHARGIVLLNRTKAGFIFGYNNGTGVALMRGENGRWGAPAFVSSTGASLGLQAGGEQDFFVILLMSPQTADDLTKQNINFGAGVSETGGNQNSHWQTSTGPSQSVMVYGEHNGYFGGVSVKGGAISPDNHANEVYYGQPVSMSGILVNHQVQPSRTEEKLLGKISYYSKSK